MVCFSAPLVASSALALATDRSQQDGYSVRHWTTEDGLPVNHVADIAQTPDGYIWLATGGGLLRYNGYEFRAFTRADFPGWRSSLVTSLEVGADSSIWARSELHELARIHRGVVETYDLEIAESASFKVVHLTGSPKTLDGGSAYWLPARRGFVLARDGGFRLFTRGDGLPSDTVVAVYNDVRGDRWVVTARGTARWDGTRFVPEGHSFRLRATPNAMGTDSLFNASPTGNGEAWALATCGVLQLAGPDGTCFDDVAGVDASEVLALSWGHPGDVWVSTPRRLARWDDQGFEVIPLDGLETHTGFEGLTRTDAGLWLYGYGRDRLYLVRDGSAEHHDLGARPAPRNVLAVHEDSEGSLWIGSDVGLFQLVHGSVHSIAEFGLGDTFLFSILQSRVGARWVGGTGTLTRFDADGIRTFALARSRSDDYFRALLEDDDGRIWVGAISGLYTVEGTQLLRRDMVPASDRGSLTSAELNVEPRFHAVAQDKAGRIWAGGKFLLRLTPRPDGGFRQERVAIDTEVWALHSDRRGRMWAGGRGGLYRREEGGWYRYDPTDGFAGGFVVSFFEENDGDLWIGTHGGGLYRLRDGAFDHLTVEDGLHADEAWRILDDGSGHLWISSNSGLARYRKTELEAVAGDFVSRAQPMVLTELDGMPSSECNRGSPAGWRMNDGSLWFPCIGGVSVVDPANVSIDPQPPPVHIEDIEVDEESIGSYDEAVLAAGTGSIAFTFAALSFADPKRNRYRFYLDGYEDGWTEAGDTRRARYTNLPAGRYTFRVQGSNGDGVFNTAGDTFRFAVRPHWYRTSWFYMLVAVFIALGGYGIHRGRQATIVRRTRRQIADDLHDHVGSKLGGISHSLDAVASHLAEPARDDVLATSAESRALLSDIRDTVWVVDGSLNSLADLVERVRQVAEELLRDARVDVTVEGELRRPLTLEKRRHVLFFCKEVLHNSSRHGDPSAVTVAFRVSGKRMVTVRIEDDGRGFDSGGSGGRGLSSLRRRSDELGGTMEVSSIPDRGTAVVLSFKA